MNCAFWVISVLILSLGLVASVSYPAGPGGKAANMTLNNFDLTDVSARNPQGRFLGLVNGIMIDSKGQAFALVNHGDYDIFWAGGGN